MSDQITSTFQLEGMHCAACQKVVQKKMGSITDAQIKKLEMNGQLELTAQREISKEEVVKALEGTHYNVAAQA